MTAAHLSNFLLLHKLQVHVTTWILYQRGVRVRHYTYDIVNPDSRYFAVTLAAPSSRPSFTSRRQLTLPQVLRRFARYLTAEKALGLRFGPKRLTFSPPVEVQLELLHKRTSRLYRACYSGLHPKLPSPPTRS